MQKQKGSPRPCAGNINRRLTGIHGLILEWFRQSHVISPLLLFEPNCHPDQGNPAIPPKDNHPNAMLTRQFNRSTHDL